MVQKFGTIPIISFTVSSIKIGPIDGTCNKSSDQRFEVYRIWFLTRKKRTAPKKNFVREIFSLTRLKCTIHLVLMLQRHESIVRPVNCRLLTEMQYNRILCTALSNDNHRRAHQTRLNWSNRAVCGVLFGGGKWVNGWAPAIRLQLMRRWMFVAAHAKRTCISLQVQRSLASKMH